MINISLSIYASGQLQINSYYKQVNYFIAF